MNNLKRLETFCRIDSNLESTPLCPSKAQYTQLATHSDVSLEQVFHHSLSPSPIPMLNNDGIEHLIQAENTPTEALENLLQNAHNLTFNAPPQNPVQRDLLSPNFEVVNPPELLTQISSGLTNMPPEKRPRELECNEATSSCTSCSQSKCAKGIRVENETYENILRKHVRASKEGVGLVHKARLELFRCIITFLFNCAVPPMLENSIRNVSVHSVVQIAMDMDENPLCNAFTLVVEHTSGSPERTFHRVPGVLVEALRSYFTAVRPFFVTKETKLALARYEKDDKRAINTEFFFVNSIGKTDFRVKSVVDLFLDSMKAEQKSQNSLKSKVAELMPLSNDPSFKLEKMKHAVNLVLFKVEGFDKDEVRRAVRSRQGQQRYSRQSARAIQYFDHVNGKISANGLESKVGAFFQRKKWVSLEDRNQDVKKVTAQLLILSNNMSIRKLAQIPDSSGIRYVGLSHNLPYEEQVMLSQRCKTQQWPGICLAKMSQYGRCVIATQNFSKDDILMDYHGEVYLNISFNQVLEKEGVEQEFVLEVISGSQKTIIDATKEICSLHPSVRCPGRLANHSQLKTNAANMKPTVIELYHDGSKIVVFRATRDIQPFEQLRWDYNDPVANRLFQEPDNTQPLFTNNSQPRHETHSLP